MAKVLNVVERFRWDFCGKRSDAFPVDDNYNPASVVRTLLALGWRMVPMIAGFYRSWACRECAAVALGTKRKIAKDFTFN